MRLLPLLLLCAAAFAVQARRRTRVINGKEYRVVDSGKIKGSRHGAPDKIRINKVSGMKKPSAEKFVKRQFGLGSGRSHSLADRRTVRQVSLRLHNDLRRNVSTGSLPGQPRSASPLRSLVWDARLESSAAAYAKKCVWRHSLLKGVGENLAIRYHGTKLSDVRGTKGRAKARQAAAFHNQGWIDEYKYFRSPFKVGGLSCLAGEKCGHYTQMVWEGTTRIGCAMSFCSEVEGWLSPRPGQLVSYLVCHYDPPGNYRGTTPYEFAGSSKGKKKTSRVAGQLKPSRRQSWKTRRPAKTSRPSRPAKPLSLSRRAKVSKKPRRTSQQPTKKPAKMVPRSWVASNKEKRRPEKAAKPRYWRKASKACTVTCRAGQSTIFDKATGSCYCF